MIEIPRFCCYGRFVRRLFDGTPFQALPEAVW
jgi:hypothetical protein